MIYKHIDLYIDLFIEIWRQTHRDIETATDICMQNSKKCKVARHRTTKQRLTHFYVAFGKLS